MSLIKISTTDNKTMFLNAHFIESFCESGKYTQVRFNGSLLYVNNTVEDLQEQMGGVIILDDELPKPSSDGAGGLNPSWRRFLSRRKKAPHA